LESFIIDIYGNAEAGGLDSCSQSPDKTIGSDLNGSVGNQSFAISGGGSFAFLGQPGSAGG
jgi:hypothetical protein